MTYSAFSPRFWTFTHNVPVPAYLPFLPNLFIQNVKILFQLFFLYFNFFFCISTFFSVHAGTVLGYKKVIILLILISVDQPLFCVFFICIFSFLWYYLISITEPCHFDTVPVQVPTSYFPSYGSGYGSLHNYKKILKIKFLSIIFLLKIDRNRLIWTLKSLFFFSYSDFFLKLMYQTHMVTHNRSRNLE